MTEGQPQVARVEPGEVTPTLVTTLYTGALVSRVEAGVVALTGPGAVTSFQGLLTNDVELPGDGSFVYGALLTPKGMIVVDGWAARLGATVSYTVPAHGGGRERALAIFTRSVPPRLARVSDRTSEVAVYRLAGPGALAVAVAAGLEVPPAAGRVLPRPDGVETARATEGAPFVLQVTVPAAAAALLAARLEAAGAVAAGPATLELSRILAGWPRLGAEVDDRTIPQEARLDQIGGVSYTKGCYTGQETVARLHFRGHVRSEEHTSELQSRLHLVCRLLLEKKKQTHPQPPLLPQLCSKFNHLQPHTCSGFAALELRRTSQRTTLAQQYQSLNHTRMRVRTPD